MKQLPAQLGLFFANTHIRVANGICIVLIVTQTILLFLTFQKLPPQIPLFYSLPWGERRLAPRLDIVIFPLLSFAVMSFNTLMALLIFQKEKILSQILIWSAVLITLIATIGVVKIIFLIS